MERYPLAHRDQWDQRGLLRVVALVGQGDPLAHQLDAQRLDVPRTGSEVDGQGIVARCHLVEWVGQRARRQSR